MDIGTYRFLIIDDHAFARRSVSNELKQCGATLIDEAADGVEGLQKIKQQSEAGQPYDIVFLDWAMPNLDGKDVLLACRADHALDQMAIIMLSAESEDENILSLLEAGATAYITKPFKPEMLAHKLEDVLSWKATS